MVADLKQYCGAYIGAACAVLAPVAVLSALLVPATAWAQAAEGQKAQAQMLFDEGKRLMAEGKIAEGCTALAESQRLDPAIGTQLNLANCYEQAGKTASAWAAYRDVETLSRRAGQENREQIAKEGADRLEPKLSRLVIEIKKPAKDIKVTRDGVVVSTFAFGKAIPVDPGKVTIVAEAPGKKRWTKDVEVAGVAAQVSVSVPLLEDAPVAPVKSASTGDADAADGSLHTILGVVAVGTGVAVAGAGVALRFVALGKDDDSFAFCEPNDPLTCTQEGADLRDEAQLFQTLSTVAWATGGAMVVAGVVLFLTAPSGDEPASEQAGAPMIDWNVRAGALPGADGQLVGQAVLELQARW